MEDGGVTKTATSAGGDNVRRRRGRPAHSNAYEKDPGVEYGRKLWHNDVDGCSRVVQLLYLCIACIAVVFSVMAATSCDFLEYVWPPDGQPPVGVPISSNMTSADIVGTPVMGLWRHSPSGSGFCVRYDHSIVDVTPSLRGSRLMAVIGGAAGGIALLLLLVELLCCRFWCSRMFIGLLFLIAAVGQALTLCLYLGEVCDGRKGDKYLCNVGGGTIWTIVATVLYMICSLMACATPKATPVVRILLHTEALSVVDPCCCCCQGRTRDEVLEEQTSLIQHIEAQDEDGAPVVAIGGTGGRAYPQQYASGAGCTLRDQYNAAYDRWVRAEENYDQALDRFKVECGEAEPGSWRDIKNMNVEEIEDDDIRRRVVLLEELKAKCDGARDSMEAFQRQLFEAVARDAASRLDQHQAKNSEVGRAASEYFDAEASDNKVNEPGLGSVAKSDSPKHTSIMFGSHDTTYEVVKK